MDLFSYLLGKKSSSGGGGGSDLSEYFNETITAFNTRVYRGEWVNYIKKLPTLHDNILSAAYYFYGFVGEEIDLSGFHNSNISTANRMFYECTNLKNIIWGDFNFTSSLTDMQYMFYGCTSLETADLFYTSNVRDFGQCFRMCTNLKNVPIYDTSKAESLSSMFSNCSSLTDTSLDNILQMCINATSYIGTKTLAQLGFTSTTASVSRVEALPHYSDFISAGWSIGY